MSATGMRLLDASKARNCPAGVTVTVVATESAPARKVTPRIIVGAVRRGWPVVNYGWTQACVLQGSIQPLEGFTINAHNLLVRAKPKLAVSQEAAGTSNWSILTMCAISICITNNITITVYVMA